VALYLKCCTLAHTKNLKLPTSTRPTYLSVPYLHTLRTSLELEILEYLEKGKHHESLLPVRTYQAYLPPLPTTKPPSRPSTCFKKFELGLLGALVPRFVHCRDCRSTAHLPWTSLYPACLGCPLDYLPACSVCLLCVCVLCHVIIFFSHA
jgi:hypothetical protein